MRTENCAGPVVGVIPLNRLDRAKSRLAAALTPAERASLVLALAARTLAALQGSGVISQIVVVSPDAQALAWAQAHGAAPLPQASLGLNAGLSLARAWAVERHASGLLIALGDLPTLTPEETQRFVTMTRLYDRVVALAPDRAGEGTNLLLARPASLAPLAYGRGSFARHRRLARRIGVPTLEFHSPGAAFDVDAPADLAELIARGVWSPAQPIEDLGANEVAAEKERP